MIKDWTGDKNSVYKMLGASNHADGERQKHDYYATEPRAMELLLESEIISNNVWECACGEGHLSEVLIEKGYNVKSTDLIDRGYGLGGVDFLMQEDVFNGDIITNPPYKHAMEFVYKALELVPVGNKVAMFLKLQFLETKKRRKLFDEYPPKVVYVSSSRLLCAKNADFKEAKRKGGSAVAYAWFVWTKGHQGDTIVKWIN